MYTNTFDQSHIFNLDLLQKNVFTLYKRHFTKKMHYLDAN